MREHAQRFAVAEVIALGRGRHRPPDMDEAGMLGMLVLDGLMIETLAMAERRSGNVISPGDVLGPCDDLADSHPVPHQITWQVIEPVRLALLDRRIALVCARWPALMHEIVRRAVWRSDSLMLIAAVRSLQHVENRLLVVMWDLADRLGRVTAEGTMVPVKLSHANLALLTGGTRPSVSSALARLSHQGVLSRRSDRTWLLNGAPPQPLNDYRRSTRLRAREVA